MSSELRNQPLFGNGQETRIAVASHNVSYLIPLAEEGMREQIDLHYGQRAGAMDWHGAKRVGILSEHPDGLRSHASYMGEMFGFGNRKKVEVFSPKDLQNGNQKERTLVVPYIKNESVERDIQRLGAEAWGMDTRVVEALKDKANFHRLVSESHVDGIEVPDYSIARLADLVPASQKMLRDIESLYSEYNLSGRYDEMLMIRLHQSDGNYGSTFLRQQKDGRIRMLLDGNPDNERMYRNGEWGRALSDSQKYLSESVDSGRDPEVVISRGLELNGTPGMSVVFLDGKAYSLGWNGQIQREGSTAAIGTSTFTPANQEQSEMKKKYEDSSAKSVIDFVGEVARKQGVSPDSLHGIINVDLMLPGEAEKTLRERRGKIPANGIYLAESNPRWTNFTDAVVNGVAIARQITTVNSMMEVIDQGVLTNDKLHLPPDVNPETLRSVLGDRKDNAAQQGIAVFVRMTDNPMGVILYGNHKKAEEELQNAIGIARKVGTKGRL